MERLTFRFVTAGFVLLSATLLAGLLFSETLRRQHARLEMGPQDRVLGARMAHLRGAADRTARFGWRGRTARRVLYAGAVVLLLAYVGSRFVLEVVLARATP